MVKDKFYGFESVDDISQKISAIDELITLQLNEILHHPEFKALEAMWRGLYYLVNQKESSLRVKIKIFNTRKSDLLKDFERNWVIEESAIYKLVFSDVYKRGFEAPFGLLIGAFEFDHLPQDMTVIENMAKIAAIAHAPFIAGVSPSMFYWESFEEVDETRDISVICQQTQYNRWNSFRETANSRYVGLCMPHILLRDSYKTDKNFIFRESAERQDLLWGNAAFAFAGCVARAYEEKSWLGRMRGIDSDGAVEGLSSQNSEDHKISLDVNLERFLSAISNLGFMSLANDLGVKPYFFNSQSTAKPKIYDSEVATHIGRLCLQLENILAVSRFAVNIMSFRLDNFFRINSKEECRKYLINWLARYYHDDDNAPDEIKAQRPLREFNLLLEEIPDKPGDYKAVIFIRPTYLLDDLQIAMRAEIYLPSPG